MEKTKWVEFDCLEMDWAVKGLQVCFDATPGGLSIEDQERLMIHIVPYGPGGGNPCLSVQGMTEPTAKIVRAWLIKNGMAWHDETGTLHDWTSTHDENGERISDPCCDVAVGLDPDCFCDK